jgi:hypothetical protein
VSQVMLAQRDLECVSPDLGGASSDLECVLPDLVGASPDLECVLPDLAGASPDLECVSPDRGERRTASGAVHSLSTSLSVSCCPVPEGQESGTWLDLALRCYARGWATA